MNTGNRNIYFLLQVCGLGLALAGGTAVAGGPAAAFLLAQHTHASQGNGSGTSAASPHVRAHQDHKPKHGGRFFMSLDNVHHLEATLDPPATFRLYIYDAYTHPVTPARVKEASGILQWGDAAGAPETPLTVSKDGETLEASLNREAKLPLNLTLRLRLPGFAPGAKPEVFRLPFSHFTEAGAPPDAGAHHH